MMTRGLLISLCLAVLTTAVYPQQSVVDKIKLMDRQWIIEAYSSRDLKDFDRIVAEEFLITSGNGKIQTKAEKRAGVAKDYTDPATMSQPDYIFKIDGESHHVRVFGDSAVSNGSVIENYVWKGTKIDGRVYFTNTYVKRKGSWQVVASHFTYVKQS